MRTVPRGVAILLACALLGYAGSLVGAQAPSRGTLSGAVTADRGRVVGFRVAAHNLDRRIWYIVFTAGGRFTVPQALPGRYDIVVNEPGFDSPTMSVTLDAGGTATAELSITRKTGAQAAVEDEMLPANRRGSGKRIQYVSTMEEIFPPGPGQDLVKKLCVGCHRDGGTFRGAQTVEDFLRGVEKETETGPAGFPNVLALGRTIVPRKDKVLIAEYLARNFGPGVPERRLRVDPLIVDEAVASRLVYVGYDIPDDLPLELSQGRVVGAPMVDGVFPERPAPAIHHLQAPALAPDGSVWFSSRVSNSLLRLDPRALDPEQRWTDFPIKGDSWVAVSGVAADSKGRIYWSELNGGMVGELDPATGKQIRYVVPQQGVDVGIIVDKDDNIGFGLIWGALFGRIDARTRTLHTYPTPTPDNGIYGLATDAQGNLWGAGWQKGTISKWDAETESVREYFIPEAWGQLRRIGVDSKGVVWASAYNVGSLIKLDPQTGRTTEYKIPVSGAIPYESWPDKDDNIWTCDEVHSTLIKFDQKTERFTFYPMPQPHQSLPKLEVEGNNTLWFGSRNVPSVIGVHMYPDGYTATAPPLP